jgi:hypothetical protein
MDRVSLSSSSEIPVNSPVLKMREFEFQVAAMHRENDELRLIIEQKNKEIQTLLAEKSKFVQEQEEAEQRYMELEDKFIELERQVKRGGPSAQSTASSSSSHTTTINVAASSSPYVNNNGNNYSPSPLGLSQSLGRSSPSSLSSSSQTVSPPNYGTALSSSQAVNSPSPLANSTTALSSSTSVVPSMSNGVARGKAPVSPTLTSCVVDHHASHLEVSVVPSPTPAKKSRKKSIISLFSL